MMEMSARTSARTRANAVFFRFLCPPPAAPASSSASWHSPRSPSRSSAGAAGCRRRREEGKDRFSGAMPHASTASSRVRRARRPFVATARPPCSASMAPPCAAACRRACSLPTSVAGLLSLPLHRVPLPRVPKSPAPFPQARRRRVRSEAARRVPRALRRGGAASRTASRAS